MIHKDLDSACVEASDTVCTTYISVPYIQAGESRND